MLGFQSCTATPRSCCAEAQTQGFVYARQHIYSYIPNCLLYSWQHKKNSKLTCPSIVLSPVLLLLVSTSDLPPIHVTLSCGSCLTVMVHSCLLFQVPTSLPATQLILPSYFLGLVSVQAELADCFHHYPSFLGRTCYAWLRHKLAHRLCVCVRARTCTCAHVCVFMWRPENSLWCIPQSTSTFFFEPRSLTEPGCWQFGWIDLPASPNDPPVCLSAVGLCALASESGFLTMS